jgi:hypothetical protein
MNSKHLTRVVATVGAVLVLYVLSFAPVTAHLAERYAYEKPEGVIFYAPMYWLDENSHLFRFVHDPYAE